MRPTLIAYGKGTVEQAGFALPLALAAIALLSVVTIAGYRAVTGSSEAMQRLDDNAVAELSLFSAESEAIFTFLSGSAVSGGIITRNAGAIDTVLFQTDAISDDISPSEYWRANGERRRATATVGAVTVAFYDAAGFPLINTLPESVVARLLARAGFTDDDAARFAARIADYQDSDTNRRFRGAERAEYRLFNRTPPANSPMRTPAELASVLGYADEAPFESWAFFTENVRFGGVGSTFNPQLGNREVADLFAALDNSPLFDDPLLAAASVNAAPSDTARFLLTYSGGAGLTHHRAVEIMRTAVAVDKPFRRVWIYDKGTDEDATTIAADARRNMAPVFAASPAVDPG